MAVRNPALPVRAGLAGAALLGAALFAGCGRPEATAEAADAPPESQPATVVTVTARTATLSQTLSISGSLAPQSRVAVGSKLPGRLERVLVDIGDRVRPGQVLATLDAREIVAQVDAADAAVNVARAQLESADAALSNATLEHDRATNLFDKGAIPRQRLDAADTAHRNAVAQRDLARATLAQAEAALRRAAEVKRDTTLTSPIGGVVVERNYDAGNLVNPGDKAVVVIADASVLKLDAGVGELEAGRLRTGMPAAIDVQARPGVTYHGTLAAMAPEIDARNRHFQIQVRVPNPGGDLLSGMYATARIETARAAQAVVLPREAVATRDGHRMVLQVADGRVQPTRVTEGLSDDRQVQIVSGVSPGAIVVADARQTLAPGTRVAPVKSDGAAPVQ